MGEIVMSTKEQKMYDQAIQVMCKRLTIGEFAILIISHIVKLGELLKK